MQKLSIYSDFSPLDIRYAAGQRPMLEKLVDKLCADKETDQDKVLAILDYVHRGYQKDNVDIFPDKSLAILNAVEEEILKLGKVSCECHSRLIICLCQIAGFPARFVSSYSFIDPNKDFKMRGGHTMVEIYLNGKWSLFDSDHGFFCLMDDERIAHLHEIMKDPSLVLKQPEWVYHAFGRDKEWHLLFKRFYLSEYSVITYSNYGVDEYLKYDWNWIPLDNDGEAVEEITEARKKLRLELLDQYHDLLPQSPGTAVPGV